MNASTVIVYASKHHGNTKNLLEAIAEQEDVELLDIAENEQYDLSGYDRIGIASGIAYGKYYPQIHWISFWYCCCFCLYSETEQIVRLLYRCMRSRA
jgi:flavodoxin